MTPEQISNTETTLKKALRVKFKNYSPEPSVMPFHTRLLGKDRLALYSFIHSLNTNFGTSIFEPVALALANNSFKVAKSQATAGTSISSDAFLVIQCIINDLNAAQGTPNKLDEIDRIRSVCRSGVMQKVKLTRVDIWLESYDEGLFLFDLKTAKPNAGGFKEFKRTLLEWAACVLADNPQAKIHSIIAIPYNPYAPNPYNRWTMRGMLDLSQELKVAEEFWDFVGGQGCYQDLLDIFERIGIELRQEIDEYFARFLTQ